VRPARALGSNGGPLGCNAAIDRAKDAAALTGRSPDLSPRNRRADRVIDRTLRSMPAGRHKQVCEPFWQSHHEGAVPMNDDQLAGAGQDLKGKVKETLGDAAGDPALQRDGLADQLAGKGRKALGAAKNLARERPFAFAALAGVVGIAFLNSLRGRR
jgi:uncharacterized protein YjbJ (UPF0337 family)